MTMTQTTAHELAGSHIGSRVQVSTDDGRFEGTLHGVQHRARHEYIHTLGQDVMEPVLVTKDVRIIFERGCFDVPPHAEVVVHDA